MRRGRILILFALIVIIGVFAVYVAWNKWIQPPDGGPTPTPAAPLDTTFIVIASQSISRGARIPADGVTLSPYPRDMVVETMIENDINQVVGRYARQAIPRGAPITTGMITEKAGDLLGTGSEAAIAIPPGLTAIAVPMNRLSGVAYALQDGDAVDVIITMLLADLDPDFQTALPNESLLLVGPDGTLVTGMACQELDWSDRGPICKNPEPPPFGRAVVDEQTLGIPLFSIPTEGQRPRLVTQRLIQNALVLHVGTFPFAEEEVVVAPVVEPVATAVPQAGAAQATPSAPKPPDIVTLIVTPQDALALNWAIRAGAQLVLTLRGPNDTTPTDTVSVTLQYLIQNYNITVPVRLPYGLEPRQDTIVEPVLPNDEPRPEP